MNIIIAGPTACGKTDLAIELAALLNGEIISVDSRQVYKDLTAGTAKPPGAYIDGVYNVSGVPYHLVDFLEVTQTYNGGLFIKDAAALEARIKERKKIPIFTGGTGMYMQACFGGMDKLPPADENLRRKFSSRSKEDLHAELAKIDPASAAAIPPGNIHRVMRALEIFCLSGQPASALRTGKFNADLGDNFFVYIERDKEELNRRIAARTEEIFDGMAEETKALLERGFDKNIPALKSLGYPQVIEFLEGRLSRAAAVEKIIILTRQYAKRQRTWFARYKNKRVYGGAELSAARIAGDFTAMQK